MDYLEINIKVSEVFSEILIAELSQIGFESFVENEAGFSAYIPVSQFQEAYLQELINQYRKQEKIIYSTKTIPAQNWNAVWEADYAPIIIEEQCLVRSHFHQIDKKYPYEIIINPKMSFGTGHHATTALMLEFQLTIDHRQKNVMDAGCGTGILAIMAEKRGARFIRAFDIDEWAINNSQENINLNQCTQIKLSQNKIQEIRDIHAKQFQIVLANINKNVLLEDIPSYATYLELSGFLLMSGFYEQDLPEIQSIAKEFRLTYIGHKTKREWVAAQFQKH